MFYNPLNHYWKRSNGTVFSSARNMEVDETDRKYAAWLADGNRPTAYPKDEHGEESIHELDKVLAPYGLRASPVTLDEAKVLSIAEIDAELSRLDAASLRPLCSVCAGMGTENDDILLSHIEGLKITLREERKALVADSGENTDGKGEK